jgi:pimeloyl-ACP methyl ester carboxylesterase
LRGVRRAVVRKLDGERFAIGGSPNDLVNGTRAGEDAAAERDVRTESRAGRWETLDLAKLRILLGPQLTDRVAAVKPESVARLAAMVPHAAVAVLAGASHLMPLEDPRGVAGLIGAFACAHPVAA